MAMNCILFTTKNDLAIPPLPGGLFLFQQSVSFMRKSFQFKDMIIVDCHFSPKQDNSETAKAFQVSLMFIPNRIYIPVH